VSILQTAFLNFFFRSIARKAGFSVSEKGGHSAFAVAVLAGCMFLPLVGIRLRRRLVLDRDEDASPPIRTAVLLAPWRSQDSLDQAAANVSSLVICSVIV
jgi:hypothetical protein